MTHILLIDDDERLGKLLTQYFLRFSLTITHAKLPSEAFKLLTHSELDVDYKSEKSDKHFDLIILDIMLPEMDGFEVCKTIRKHSQIPIIMLTARGEVMDRVVGIELGADDYLPKPFEPRELVVRIQSILKRVKANSVSTKTHDKKTLKYNVLVIDPNQMQVTLDRIIINLTSMEFNLLYLLAEQPNKVFDRDTLLNQLKGIDTELYSRSIDILISRLRAKLKPHTFIKTVRGSGYCFIGQR